MMIDMHGKPPISDADVRVAIISGVGTADPDGFSHLVKSALVYGNQVTITDGCGSSGVMQCEEF